MRALIGTCTGVVVAGIALGFSWSARAAERVATAFYFLPVGLLVLSLITLFVILYVSIKVIRPQHAYHVHTLWYLFSLVSFAYFSLLMVVYLYSTGFSFDPFASRPLGMTQEEILRMTQEERLRNMNDVIVKIDKLTTWIADFSLNVSSEMALVTGLLMIVIVPQTLSFIISGIFGCGSPPILVFTITRLAIMSLIKFFCIFSGICGAQSAYILFTGYPFDIRGDKIGAGTMACVALLMITVSFVISAIYYKIIPDIYYKMVALRRYITDHSRFKYINLTLMYMTRYRHT